MSFPDPLAERGRMLEDEYFRKRDRELIEKIRRAAEDDADRKALGEKTGVSDPVVLGELRELGFTPETVVLLPIVPVLQVAWAEGGISALERKMILALAQSRGITEGSAAHHQLLGWMNNQPAPAVFARAARLIGALLSAGNESVVDLSAADLVAYCQKVAGASGGVFGLGHFSLEEKEIISKIAQDLQARK